MFKFQWIAVIIGLLIGLGITQILSSFAAIVRSRHVMLPYGVSLIWAFCILLEELDNWWVLQDLVEFHAWSFPVFLMILVQPLLLFCAAAMVLPNAELREGDCHHRLYISCGRWALIALAAYQLEEILENIFYWGFPVFSWWLPYLLWLTALCVTGFFAGRRWGGLIAFAYLVSSLLFLFAGDNTATSEAVP